MEGYAKEPMMLDLTGQLIKVGEINTYYLIGGQGLPLVLLHGASTTAEEAWAHNSTHSPSTIAFMHRISLGMGKVIDREPTTACLFYRLL